MTRRRASPPWTLSQVVFIAIVTVLLTGCFVGAIWNDNLLRFVEQTVAMGQFKDAIEEEFGDDSVVATTITEGPDAMFLVRSATEITDVTAAQDAAWEIYVETDVVYGAEPAALVVLPLGGFTLEQFRDGYVTVEDLERRTGLIGRSHSR